MMIIIVLIFRRINPGIGVPMLDQPFCELAACGA
jgi:hypothetical protein